MKIKNRKSHLKWSLEALKGSSHVHRVAACITSRKKEGQFYLSKLGVSGNSKGIAIRDKKAMANHRQALRDKGKVSFYYILEENMGWLF